MSNEQQLDPLAELYAKWDAEESAAAQPGIEAAELILSKVNGANPSGIAKVLAALLLRLDSEASDLDCAKLAQEWAIEGYWGKHVANAKPLFDDCFNRLVSIGATFNNRLIAGDIDFGIWAVQEGDIRVIASECYCSCADDNIHLWIDRPLSFRGRTCSATGAADTRKYSEYAENWNLGYGDGRDKGYCFDLDGLTRRHTVKDAMFAYYKIYWSLWYLRNVEYSLNDPLELPKIVK